jgi:hypothetical protein
LLFRTCRHQVTKFIKKQAKKAAKRSGETSSEAPASKKAKTDTSSEGGAAAAPATKKKALAAGEVQLDFYNEHPATKAAKRADIEAYWAENGA